MEILNYLKRNNGSGHIVEHVGFHESGDYLLRFLFSDSSTPYRQHKYEVEKEFVVIDKSEIDLLERQTCGRRMSEYGPWEKKENIDVWNKMPNGDRCCSFCGSLHPMDVIDIAKKFGVNAIQTTTKSYKWYIHRDNVRNALEGGIKYYRHHDTDEFIAIMNSMISESKK